MLLVIAGLAILASFQSYPTEAGVVDCEDFSTIDEAYDFFYGNGGPDYDPYELDGDGDGKVCEWGVGGDSSSAGAGSSGVSNSSGREDYISSSFEEPHSYDPESACNMTVDEYGRNRVECVDDGLSDLGPMAVIAVVAGVVILAVYWIYRSLRDWWEFR